MTLWNGMYLGILCVCIYICNIHTWENVEKCWGGRIWWPSGAGVLFAFSGKCSVVCPQLLIHVSFSAWEILALTCTPIMLLPWGWEPFIAAIPVLLADGWLLGNPCCLVAAYHGWGRSLFTIVQSSWWFMDGIRNIDQPNIKKKTDTTKIGDSPNLVVSTVSTSPMAWCSTFGSAHGFSLPSKVPRWHAVICCGAVKVRCCFNGTGTKMGHTQFPFQSTIYCLVVDLPLWKIWVSWDDYSIPNMMGKS